MKNLETDYNRVKTYEVFMDRGGDVASKKNIYVRAYYNESISNEDNCYQVNVMYYRNRDTDDGDYFDEEFITTKSPSEAEILADKINKYGYEDFMPKNLVV
jgi:hypothetical protein